MLVITLERQMTAYRHRLGRKVKWAELAHIVGLSTTTLLQMRKPGHNTSLDKLEQIAEGMGIKALDLLEEIPGRRPPPEKKKTKKKAGKKTAKKKTKKKAAKKTTKKKA